jgi:hypothetical protein
MGELHIDCHRDPPLHTHVRYLTLYCVHVVGMWVYRYIYVCCGWASRGCFVVLLNYWVEAQVRDYGLTPHSRFNKTTQITLLRNLITMAGWTAHLWGL